MKLKDGIVTHRVDADYVTIFSSENLGDFQGVLRSNAEANHIMECLKEDCTPDGILTGMLAKYNGDAEAMQEDIEMVLANLRKASALEETVASETGPATVPQPPAEKQDYHRAEQELIDLTQEALLFAVNE